MSTYQLHPYQQYCHDFIVNTPYCALFLDVGLGKTLITLSAINTIKPDGHVLVIAPKPTAESTWTGEIEKWNFPFRTVSLISDEAERPLKPKARLETYLQAQHEPPSLYLINREMVPWLVENAPKGGKNPLWLFPYLIIDEMQSFKSHSAKRFKALKLLRDKGADGTIKRLIGLTGTPTPNGLLDLWSQIYLLDKGERLGRNITAYKDTFFRPIRFANNVPIDYALLPGAEEEIHERVKDLVISVDNPNITLPEVTYSYTECRMSDKERKIYNELKKDSILELGDDIVVAEHAGALANKLAQMASGSVYVNKTTTYREIHDRKLKEAAYIVENTPNPTLIAYHYRSDKERLLAYFKKLKVEAEGFDGSASMVKRWNNKKIPVMLIHPASAGHGLNLQDGGSTLIWFSIPYNLEHYIQTNGRIARQGQKRPVIIHHLITKGTIDEHIVQKLQKKALTQQDLLDAVTATLAD